MIISLLAAALIAFSPAPLTIGWPDLIPEGAPDVPMEDGVVMPGGQTGSAATVAELDGRSIRMPGFMLPLDYTDEGRVKAFLLLPYHGACIHVPPPPPNQIVFVDAADLPVRPQGMWARVWVTGEMAVSVNVNGLGNAAYTLRMTDLERYEG